jgi:SAM-dependent methyltransferase
LERGLLREPFSARPDFPAMRAIRRRAGRGLAKILSATWRLPLLRNLALQFVQRSQPWNQLMAQHEVLLKERDELKAHCKRLELDITEGHGREIQLRQENKALLRARDALERERNQLAEHSRNLCQQLMGVGDEHTTRGEYILQRMQSDWDGRARLNARYYTNSAKVDWDEEEYYKSGEQTVFDYIQSDMDNVCQGKGPKNMRVLEIGCGAGRMTRTLARIFGEVHAVDISGEMIQLARNTLSDVPNAFFYQNNGADLAVVPASQPYDFAFSFIVFQHIPVQEVVENYVREVYRLLVPGSLFKFQVLGVPHGFYPDTWFGAHFTVTDMQNIAERCHFDMRHWDGEGAQYFWLWFFKK